MLVFQLINGLVSAAVLFTVALGFSIIFGIIRILQFAHAALFVLFCFLAYQWQAWHVPFLPALALNAIAGGLIGLALEPLLLRQLLTRGHLAQILLTTGVAYIIGDIVLTVWGGDVRPVAEPENLNGILFLSDQPVPVYRLFIIGFALLLGLGSYTLLARTRYGAILRAAIEDGAMAAAVGIRTDRLFSIVFAATCALTALTAGIAAPLLQANAGMDEPLLLSSLVVVIIGGLGTITGAAAGALLFGIGDTLAKVFFPELSQLVTYSLMILVLVLHPAGLFGHPVQTRV